MWRTDCTVLVLPVVLPRSVRSPVGKAHIVARRVWKRISVKKGFSKPLTRRCRNWGLALFSIVGSLFLLQGAAPSSCGAAQFSGAVTPRLIAAPRAAALPSFTEIAVRAMPAVVNISTTQMMAPSPFVGPFGEDDPLEEFFRRFFGDRMPPRERQSLGSGFIISSDGYIVTNYHVIANAKQITVRLGQTQAEEYDAQVVGVDELTDLALIKISAQQPLPTLPLGTSATLKVGEWVIAIGNPFGLDQTVTAGIVSAKGRMLGAGPYDDFIQTDASINPGNSGGPLLNLNGEVVGVNSAILSRAGGSIGIGFAIPIDLAKSVIEQLKAKGTVTRGWLGVTVQPVTPDIAALFGIEKPRGALIADIARGGPAEQAGIRRGDILISFNEIPIRDSAELPAVVARTPVGELVKIVAIRDRLERVFTVTVGEMPTRDPKGEPDRRREERWGLNVTSITPEISRRFRLAPGQQGVLVAAVERDSAAARAGIQPGDVIEELDRREIRTLDDFDKAAAAVKDRDSLLILVRRSDSSVYLVLRRRE
jgi:serine protease Do